MHLETWADISLVIFVAIFSIIAVAALVIMALALNKLQSALTALTAKVEPIVAKASDTLDTVNRVTVNVGEKADHILARGEVLTGNVSQNIEKAANVVQTTVTTPLINLSSLISGVSKGFSVWSKASTNGARTDNRGSAAAIKSEEE